MHGAVSSQGERNFALRTQGERYARCGRSDDVVAGVARRAMLRDLNFDLVLPKVSRRVLPTGNVPGGGECAESLTRAESATGQTSPAQGIQTSQGQTTLPRISVTYVCVQVWDFVPRLAAAAGLEMEMPRRGEHGPQLSAILYFIDLSQVRSFFHLPFCLLPFICFSTQLLYEHSGRSPSLRVAVAVVCALRALRLPPRTPRIAHYAGLSDAQVCPTDAQRACRLS